MVDTSLRRWSVVAAVSVLFAVAGYLLAVCTPAGQELENAALRGADQANPHDLATATSGLDAITVTSLAAATALVALIGILRRRWELTCAAVGVIVAGQLVTQVLKRFVLPRPALVPLVGHYAQNSLPSGHTTIAMTVLFAALLVVPYRWRGVAMFLVLTWAVGIGAYTLTAKWHRLSDTLAADAISLALACLASWWLARRGMVRVHQGRRRVPRVLFTVGTVLSAVVFLALGGLLLGALLSRSPFEVALRRDAYVIYLAATCFASFGSVATALVFLATWRRREIAPATTAHREPAPEPAPAAGCQP